MRNRFALLSLSALAAALLSTTAFADTTVQWLDKAPPAAPVGVSFGVPFAQGTAKKDQAFSLKSAEGNTLPTQTWPMAYWPDGSMKWIGFATVAGPDVKGPVQVVSGNGPSDQKGLVIKVTDAADAVTIDTGTLIAKLPKSGEYLIDSLTIGDHAVATHGRLECIDQTAPYGPDHVTPPERVDYNSLVQKVTVEQSGPVRAVVKIEGVHQQAGVTVGGKLRTWLPFTVRLYFYAGQQPIRMVHTIVFDGDQDKDFIKGLGVTFDVPMREQSQNRHVRFANSNGGVWAEPLLLVLPRGRGAALAGQGNQLQGQRIPNVGADNIPENAEWDSFRLDQLSSEGFTLDKRTNPKSSWVGVGEGRRAAGYCYIGDVSGGLGLGVKNFWQAYPASLEIEGALSDTAHITAWLWSPDANAMDMRHYDTHGHGNVNGGGSYEDYEADFATPVGVGKTSELMLFPRPDVPTNEQAAVEAKINSAPPLLTETPQTLHDAGVFGVWSVQDRSTPFRKAVEDRLDAAINYYKESIDSQHWYGFWNFGDVRHNYDAARHEWRYDIGGYAWDNSELGSVLWMWYSYIRTGDADTFRMAEAMIRETSEVDTYHLGRFDGLGSRHNVSHWGDSAKEARVSQAAHAQFYYFLTTDERLGDIMQHEADVVDKVASVLDPMRKAQPITEAEKKYPGRIRVGPDWLAFVGNWMIAWERTGDPKWRDKIMAGVDSMYHMSYWMKSGKNLVMGYDYNTGKMFQVNNDVGNYNLPTIQGGAEVAFELTPLLSNDEWTKMWSQYCRLGAGNAAILTKDQQTGTEGADASLLGEQNNNPTSQGTPRLAAYAYHLTKNPAFAQFAINALERYSPTMFDTRPVPAPEALNPFNEAPQVSTNETAQESLTSMEILELCKDQLPNAMPATPPPAPGRAGRGARGARGGAPAAPAAPAPAQ